MSTKILLEEPYSLRWRFGYLNINSDGRKTLSLYNNNEDRSSTQYARYLISVKLGRFLTENEQVDHIDNDKTNDSLDNLRVINALENARKQAKLIGKQMVKITCPVCKKRFLKRKGLSPLVPSHKGRVFCCSRICSKELSSHKIDKELREFLSEESVVNEIRVHG